MTYTIHIVSVPECNAFTAPQNGAISDLASSFIAGEIQTILCDEGFRAIKPTTITCTEIDAFSTTWQPAPHTKTCGKVALLKIPNIPLVILFVEFV